VGMLLFYSIGVKSLPRLMLGLLNWG